MLPSFSVTHVTLLHVCYIVFCVNYVTFIFIVTSMLLCYIVTHIIMQHCYSVTCMLYCNTYVAYFRHSASVSLTRWMVEQISTFTPY